VTNAERLRTDNPADLEPEPVRPRASRGVVVSVRLNSAEATAVAERAARAGLSVSQFTRRALEQATATPWRLMVWNAQTPQIIAQPPETGGDYSRQLDEAASRS
jgi:Ribbon-helix-helix protein, copG family